MAGVERPVVVGITLRPMTAEGCPERLVVNRAYADSLERAGGLVLGIPTLRDPDGAGALLDGCDALVLPGGPDVGPHRYGEEPRPDCHVEVVPDLDEVEAHLAARALAADLPLLAICRGCQLLNVVCGGSLWQDITVQRVGNPAHDGERWGTPRTALVHPVAVEPGSLLASVLGRTQVSVNSIHHQALHRLGGGLRATGWSPDGMVEAVEMPGRRFVVGLQCHPEEFSATEPWAERLFTALVRAARERRAAPGAAWRPAVGG
jgi:putative glutamine amidotransferase